MRTAMLASALLALSTLAACQADPPPGNPDVQLIDGRVCGIFDPEPLRDAIGGDPTEATLDSELEPDNIKYRVVECTVFRGNEVQVLVITGEAPTKAQWSSTRRAYERDLRTAWSRERRCKRPERIKEIGPGYTCDFVVTRAEAVILFPRRSVAILIEPRRRTRKEAVDVAIDLAIHVNKCLDAYGEKHDLR